jgi:hypothetical protein
VITLLDEKLAQLNELKAKRTALGDQITKLADEIASEVTSAVKGPRKPRKPRQPKLALVQPTGPTKPVLVK